MIIYWVSITLALASVVYASYTHHLENMLSQTAHQISSLLHSCLGLAIIVAFGSIVMALIADSQCMNAIARAIKRPLRLCFLPDHINSDTLKNISLNLGANIIGAGNAATPAGIRAMHSLHKQNNYLPTASDAMCMLLAINTSSLQLIPYTPIALLAAAGDPHAWSIWPGILVITSINTIFAISCAKIFARIKWLQS